MSNEIKILRTNAEHLGRTKPTDKWEVVPRMSVKRNALRRGSDSRRRADALHDKYSHRIAASMEFDKRKSRADTQKEKRREFRRARKIAKEQHTHVPTFKLETWEIGRQVRRTER